MQVAICSNINLPLIKIQVKFTTAALWNRIEFLWERVWTQKEANQTPTSQSALWPALNCTRIDKYPFCSGTFVYWGLGSIPVLMTLVGLIYMFKTNCNPKKKCSQMFSICKSLEKTDINTIYGQEYYADGCMEVNCQKSLIYTYITILKIYRHFEKSDCKNIS